MNPVGSAGSVGTVAAWFQRQHHPIVVIPRHPLAPAGTLRARLRMNNRRPTHELKGSSMV